MDEYGRVIGIVEAYLPPGQTGAENIAFAIPSDTAVGIAKQLIANGHASHPYMGVEVETVTPELQQQDNLSRSSGALVPTVDSTGPAAKAGIQQGDIITSIDGAPVTQGGDVIVLLGEKNVGGTISVTIDRKGKSLTLRVVLVESPASASG